MAVDTLTVKADEAATATVEAMRTLGYIVYVTPLPGGLVHLAWDDDRYTDWEGSSI